MMKSDRLIEMLMRDMLFINWAVDPAAARKLAPEQFELDTTKDSSGKMSALVSAVCFRVVEVRSALLPIPRLSFEQVNYRLYVKGPQGPSVYFLDMKVNSRMVTALTSFLRVPVSYEEIDIASGAGDSTGGNYRFESSGLRATASLNQNGRPLFDPQIDSSFITHRLTGYAKAGDNMYKIEVEHPLLLATPVTIERVRAPRLIELGVLNEQQAQRPHSGFYVQEVLFRTSPPERV
jgi:uncharacterized protein YqjF (DUF2071 family)